MTDLFGLLPLLRVFHLSAFGHNEHLCLRLAVPIVLLAAALLANNATLLSLGLEIRLAGSLVIVKRRECRLKKRSLSLWGNQFVYPKEPLYGKYIGKYLDFE